MAVASGTGTAGEQNGAGLRVYANSAATSVNHGNIVITNLTSNTWSLSSVLGKVISLALAGQVDQSLLQLL